MSDRFFATMRFTEESKFTIEFTLSKKAGEIQREFSDPYAAVEFLISCVCWYVAIPRTFSTDPYYAGHLYVTKGPDNTTETFDQFGLLVERPTIYQFN